MERSIIIQVDGIRIEATLNASEVADAVWDTLPYAEQGSIWGDELYFGIPEQLAADLKNERETVEIGDIGYWPPGNAFCVFFGPTPVSVGDEPRPASPVVVFGRVTGSTEELKRVRSGSIVTVEKKPD